MILADDLDARTLAMHADVMPHLKRLIAGNGATFTRAYVATPLCSPSRVSILTGQYPHNHGIVENEGADGGFRGLYRSGLEAAALAPRLKAAGYRTSLVGKYLNGYPYGVDAGYVPPGWDDWHSPLVLATYSDYEMSENGRLVRYGATDQDYITHVLADRACAFIEAAARDGAPFFAHVGVIAPHKPALPAPMDGATYAGAYAPREDRVPSFDEDDISDKPSWLQRKPSFDADTLRLLDRLYRYRLQSLVAVDRMVARIVALLDQLGELERTYVVFTSDNGWQSGEHRYPEGKALMYEESTLVPLMVRGPGIRPGASIDAFTVNVDLAPTFLDIAGAPIPESSDGRSLVPLLEGRPPASPWRAEALVECLAYSAECPPFFMLRTDRWSYASYEYGGVPLAGERELYDMRADPFQMENLARTAPEAVVEALHERLSRLSACRGARCGREPAS